MNFRSLTIKELITHKSMKQIRINFSLLKDFFNANSNRFKALLSILNVFKRILPPKQSLLTYRYFFRYFSWFENLKIKSMYSHVVRLQMLRKMSSNAIRVEIMLSYNLSHIALSVWDFKYWSMLWNFRFGFRFFSWKIILRCWRSKQTP